MGGIFCCCFRNMNKNKNENNLIKEEKNKNETENKLTKEKREYIDSINELQKRIDDEYRIETDTINFDFDRTKEPINVTKLVYNPDIINDDDSDTGVMIGKYKGFSKKSDIVKLDDILHDLNKANQVADRAGFMVLYRMGGCGLNDPLYLTHLKQEKLFRILNAIRSIEEMQNSFF